MGWLKYIIIEKLKLKIEISRHFYKDDDFSSNIEKIEDSIDVLNEDNTLDKNLKDISVLDIGNIFHCIKQVRKIDYENYNINGFLSFLQSYNISYIV